ncbi:UTP--glucose-1-phosphate uridylyltransferase GalU [Candidatus Fukatsuia anoeciicola]|uniref:UTP--glucose-1-phosphate uridylyltransferase GalU n=1 Tax=Candidatus Fukatsuia anoeciicola TaxID=2994492 RepID=UPI003463BC83
MRKKWKAVIPVAGLGTRMLPATKAIPKEMLPIVDKPLIQYIVNECSAAGVKDIIFVTHSSKNAIENHFDTSFELETLLEKRVKRQLLKEIKEICPHDVNIMHVRQGQAQGLGHAILCAKPIIGEASFIILLPDVLLDNKLANLKQENLFCMIKKFEHTSRSQIMVKQIPIEDAYKYGIVNINGLNLLPGKSTVITNIIEKPVLNKAPSNLAVVGRYVLAANIWPLLEKTTHGIEGEIQLTDAINMLIEQQLVEAFHMTGKSYDCGDKLGYMKTFVSYGRRHETEGEAFSAWLKQF